MEVRFKKVHVKIQASKAHSTCQAQKFHPVNVKLRIVGFAENTTICARVSVYVYENTNILLYPYVYTYLKIYLYIRIYIYIRMSVYLAFISISVYNIVYISQT